MPEFLTEFIENLRSKSKKILENFEDENSNLIFKDIFRKFWIAYDLRDITPNQDVIAIDSSIGGCPLYNGGHFFVARALALGKNDRYKEVFCDFDYLERSRTENFLGRLMEWTEHLVALKAIEDGFKGTLLIDGSIFGRMSHVPIELDLVYNKGWMIEYFRTLMKLLNSCYKNGILIIGISKESRTSFFREFLIKELLKLEMSDALLANILVNTALDNKKMAVIEAKKTGSDKIVQLIQELVNRKPDGLLIMKNAKNSGYTAPLLLGASQRMRRMAQEINADVKKYILSRFPRLSDDQEFMNKAIP
ncbi:MAG: DNA double-strand break repair nuclease NurA, partial [Candidatus Helarchaeota archaeon]